MGDFECFVDFLHPPTFPQIVPESHGSWLLDAGMTDDSFAGGVLRRKQAIQHLTSTTGIRSTLRTSPLPVF